MSAGSSSRRTLTSTSAAVRTPARLRVFETNRAFGGPVMQLPAKMRQKVATMEARGRTFAAATQTSENRPQRPTSIALPRDVDKRRTEGRGQFAAIRQARRSHMVTPVSPVANDGDSTTKEDDSNNNNNNDGSTNDSTNNNSKSLDSNEVVLDDDDDGLATPSLNEPSQMRPRGQNDGRTGGLPNGYDGRTKSSFLPRSRVMTPTPTPSTAPPTPSTPSVNVKSVSTVDGAKTSKAARPTSSGQRKGPQPVPAPPPTVGAGRPQRPTITALQKEADRWRKISDGQRDAMKKLNKEGRHLNKVVAGLSACISHMDGHLQAFSTPRLKMEVSRLQDEETRLKELLRLKDDEITLAGSRADEVLEQMNFELVQREAKWCEAKYDLLQKIEELSEENRCLAEEMKIEKSNRHKDKEKLLEMHQCELAAVESKQKTAMSREHERQELVETRASHLERDLGDKKTECEELLQRVKELEDNLSQDKDKRVRAAREKIASLTNDVSSLKHVLELKDDRIKTLSQHLMSLEEKTVELPAVQQMLESMKYKVEHLESILEQKTEQHNKILCDYETLKSVHNKEIREKHRLSMRNEELEYSLNETMTASMSSSLPPTPARQYFNANSMTCSAIEPLSLSAASPRLVKSASHTNSTCLVNEQDAVTPPPAVKKSKSSPYSVSLAAGRRTESKGNRSRSLSKSESSSRRHGPTTATNHSGHAVDGTPPPPTQSILDSGFEDIYGLLNGNNCN